MDIYLTKNEQSVMLAIADNFFQNGDTSYRSAVWSDSINDSHSPSAITGKALSGVVSSLSKKGLLGTNDEIVWLTEQGAKLIDDLRPRNVCVDCRPPVNDCDSCYESDCACNLAGHRSASRARK